MSIYKDIALCYKTKRITALIDEDIKLIKKLNSLLIKLEKTDKEQTILEAMNIIRALDNIFDFNLLYSVLYEFIDVRFFDTLLYMIEKNKTLTYDEILKLKSLAEE